MPRPMLHAYIEVHDMVLIKIKMDVSCMNKWFSEFPCLDKALTPTNT